MMVAVPRKSRLIGGVALIDFLRCHRETIAALTALVALVVSSILLWLRYGTSRRQKHADNPFFSFTREQNRKCVTIANKGSSAARDVAVRTKKGTFVKWAEQVNEAERVCVDELYGDYEGGEEPWTVNCDGAIVNMDPGQCGILVLAKDVREDEVLIVSFKNYMGDAVTQRQPLKGMSQAKDFNTRTALL